MFIAEINTIEIIPKVINSSNEMLFNPFEVNEDKYYSPLYEIDPDINYYNTIGSHLGSSCNYYFEDYFETALKSKGVDITATNILSLCHSNIRSMRANLSSFEICLKNMEYKFSVIGLSETWLRDYNCNLYNIDGYTFTEVHRSEKAGGGVGIFVREDVPYQVRNDMCEINDVYECVFIEIDKEYFHKEKNIIMGVIYRPPGTEMVDFLIGHYTYRIFPPAIDIIPTCWL